MLFKKKIHYVISIFVFIILEYFLEPLINQSCSLDDNCQLSCRTSGAFLTPVWYKDNKTIDECNDFKITSQNGEVDNIYHLNIPSIKADQEGLYMIKLGNRSCSASVKVKGNSRSNEIGKP